MTEQFKLDRYVILHLCDVSSSEDTGLMLGAEKNRFRSWDNI